MRRESAIFSGSRLYRQAQEGSLYLFDRFSENNSPFEAMIGILTDGKDVLRVSGVEDCRQKLSLTQRHVIEMCSQISAYIAIPILIQAISDFYYGANRLEPAWMGTALKGTLAYVWKDVHNTASITSALSQIGDAVVVMSIQQQLEILHNISEIFEEGEVSYSPDGWYTAGRPISRYLNQYAASFRDRGMAFRTANDSNQAIIAQPDAAFAAITRILQGESPDKQVEFHGTLFSQISKSESLEFWAELWCRLHTLFSSAAIRNTVTQDYTDGVVLFEPFAIPLPAGLSGAYVQRIYQRLFWNRDWHREKIRNWSSNMIVERPILRISNSPELYATSLPLIGDSLNWFVEASVMQYRNSGGIALSSSFFEKYISESFEAEVIEMFEKYHFIAGSVNDNGTWKIGKEHIHLQSIAGTSLPGQVDALVIHPASGVVLVVECKVLALPKQKSQLRNIFSKLGEQDSEGFHAKLHKKIEWLRNAYIFQFMATMGYEVGDIQGLIILNRKVPGMMAGPFPVVDSEMLGAYLEENFGGSAMDENLAAPNGTLGCP